MVVLFVVYDVLLTLDTWAAMEWTLSRTLADSRRENRNNVIGDERLLDGRSR